MKGNYKRLKYACYTTNVSMSIVTTLSPLLFSTFNGAYGISFTLLGLLVLISFCTQLIIDLLFSFFSHKFNIPLAVKITPVLTVIGLIIYALAPIIFPNSVYLGIVIGTVIFSASSGFAEVLISPVVATIPSDNPDRQMSMLHSIYAWGVIAVVIISTVFLHFLGYDKWQYLALILGAIPLVSAILFAGAKIPEMQSPEKVSKVLEMFKRKEVWLCVVAIFLGGASECSMASWSSSYIEQSLGLPKIWGDICGVAFFSLMLALGRTLYAKKGKNIENFLFFGAIGATVCYLVATFVNISVIGLIACGLTGFCVAMMWPGSLIVAEQKVKDGGVFIFALMAAGGDLGGSVGPQLIGAVTDAVALSPTAINLAQNVGLTATELGMKAGMAVASLFPLIAIFVFLHIYKSAKKSKQNQTLSKEI